MEQIFEAMRQEYCVRRRMIIERAKVTLQSMLWAKEYLESNGTADAAAAAAYDGQSRLHEDPAVQLSDVYGATLGVFSWTWSGTSIELTCICHMHSGHHQIVSHC